MSDKKGMHVVGFGDMEMGRKIKMKLCRGWDLRLRGTTIHESVDIDKIPFDEINKAIQKLKKKEVKV